MKRLSLFALCASMLLLGACVTREQADEQLAKGCQAGISVLLPDDQKIDKIIRSEYTPASEGVGFRHVTIVATLENDWLEEEYEYQCVFDENFGFLKSSYSAAIMKLDTGDGRIYGQAGARILGDAQDWIKITAAVNKAMY